MLEFSHWSGSSDLFQNFSPFWTIWRPHVLVRTYPQSRFVTWLIKGTRFLLPNLLPNLERFFSIQLANSHR